MKPPGEGKVAKGDRSRAPVFVLGCSRSGTTLLYHTILSAGNFAVYQSESDVFNVIAPAFGDLRSKANRAKMMGAWLKSDHFNRSGLDADDIRKEVLSDCSNAGDFLRIVMGRIAQKQGVERWADNTPTHLLHIRQIKATIPNALIIHIIRDGRDVAMSLDRLGWGWVGHHFPWDRNHGLLVSALYWEWIVRKGREVGRELGSDYLEVRYEELVQRPRETLSVLSDFIHHDLNYERIQQSGIGAVRKPTSAFSGIARGDNFNPVGRWKGLKGAEAERMEALLAPLLRELGYQVSSDAKLDFTAWRLRVFYLAYRELKQLIKQSPAGRFVISREILRPGYLDRVLSRWEAPSSGLQG